MVIKKKVELEQDDGAEVNVAWPCDSDRDDD